MLISKGGRSQYNVGDIFRRYGQAYELSHPMSSEQRQVMHDLSMCRTAYLGGHLEQCEGCGYERPVYNSCGNVSCPMCQGIRRRRWLNERLAELLPVSYFHCIFTLPHEINDLASYNQRLIYNLLFRSAADTLLKLSKKYHDAVPAIIATLHTWGQNLSRHPHIHILVTSGGLKEDGNWHYGHSNYLFDVFEMSAEFKQIFLRGLRRLHKKGELHKDDNFAKIYKKMAEKEWVIHCKKPFAGAEKVVEYLSRYVYRSAIANSRIQKVDDSAIEFDYKDYRDTDEQDIARHKTMKLDPTEFMRRFLQHVLPKGFRRCRFYGIFAGGCRKEKLAKCRHIFNITSTAEAAQEKEEHEKEEHEKEKCPQCGCCSFVRVAEIFRVRPPPISFHYFMRRQHA